ncbi:MAG TPA: alpha-N-acetylglucosaminidase TIM-barrel domain-containing protein [Terriglobia bacterium]|nr:alpha-N-acetylglucosaminidase TIM-barrel domain-containing protein [Terriglobia bacterium]
MNRRNLLQSLAGSLVAQSVMARQTTSVHSPAQGEGVRAEHVLIVYNSSTPIEKAAAGELARFLQRMTGKLPDSVDEAKSPVHPGGRVSFLVGRTSRTNELLRAGALDDPARKHEEAYLVRSLKAGGSQAVAFLGASGTATLYAVYHYLEKFCGMGFFWDGDQVPAASSVPAEGIAISAHPQFSERYYGNGCIWVYSTPWWHWEEWQRYLDWMVKKRLNTFFMSWSPGVNAVWKSVWAKFGIKVSGEPDKWLESRAELDLRIVNYARSRGLRIVAPAVGADVPAGFANRYPDTPILKGVWSGTTSSFMVPDSPMYRKVCRVFLEEYNSRYGNDHLYVLADLSETAMKGSEEAKRKYVLDLPRVNLEVIREIDPQGIGLLQGWTFLGKEWPAARARECIQQLPAESIRVVDFWAERQPLYKEMDYFEGTPWIFGVLNSFGGDTHLHGDMRMLGKQMKTVSQDDQARKCTGFALVNEVSGFNYFYFELATKLGWNPSEVELRSFTHEYAITRYGVRAAEPMQRALNELLASVYSSDAFAKPLYWHRLDGKFNADVWRGRPFIPHLRRAVEYALEASEAAKANPLYLHDLNDITRAYLGQVFNLQVMAMAGAVERLDERTFLQKAASLRQILDSIEKLLSHDDYYWLTPSIRSAQSLPGAPANIDRRVRDILTLLGGYPALRDYACRDTYEMVRGYYRPRVEVFIKGLRRQLRNWQRTTRYQPDEVIMAAQYEQIEKKWVEQGFPLVEFQPAPQETIPTARRILQQIGA